jgi:hypothetical protein
MEQCSLERGRASPPGNLSDRYRLPVAVKIVLSTAGDATDKGVIGRTK